MSILAELLESSTPFRYVFGEPACFYILTRLPPTPAMMVFVSEFDFILLYDFTLEKVWKDLCGAMHEPNNLTSLLGIEFTE